MTTKKPTKEPAKKRPKPASAKKQASKRRSSGSTGPKAHKGGAKSATSAEGKSPEPVSTDADRPQPKPKRHYVTRPADIEDVPAMVAIGNELGLFDPDDTEKAVELLTQYFSGQLTGCLLYTSPSPRDATLSRMPSSA